MNVPAITVLLAAVLTLSDHAFLSRTARVSSGSVDNPLILQYKFNEGSGTNIADYTGNYSAFAVGGTWVTGASGSGSALQFNGTSDFCRSSNQVAWGTNAVSVTLWLWWDSFADDDDLAFETGPNIQTTYPGLFLDPNCSWLTPDFLVAVRDAGGYSYRLINRPSSGAWHHYVITVDRQSAPTSMALYLDGSLQTVTTNANATSQTSDIVTSHLYLMSRAGTTFFGAGRMDDFRAYSGVLSAAEVSAIYADPQ